MRYTFFIPRFVAICIALVFAGCATMIPETDSTPPSIELTIRGPGIATKRMTNPPRETWTGPSDTQYFDLLPEASYNFTLVVSDDGGVSRAHLRMPSDLTVSRLSPADTTNEVTGVSRALTLRGDRDDPRQALVITGTFQTSNALLSFDFQTEADDFGGRAGTRNQRFMNVTVAVNPP